MRSDQRLDAWVARCVWSAAVAIAAGFVVYVLALAEPEPSIPAPLRTTVAETTTTGRTPGPEQGEGGPDAVDPAWAVTDAHCQPVRDLLARHGVTGDTAERFVWIAHAETDCGADETHNGIDHGLFQLNFDLWGGPLCRKAGICTYPWELAHDDDVQMEAALAILGWRGWRAWCWATPEQVARHVGYTCPWS